MDQHTLNKIADALELIVSALRGDGVCGQGRCDDPDYYPCALPKNHTGMHTDGEGDDF